MVGKTESRGNQNFSYGNTKLGNTPDMTKLLPSKEFLR